MSFANGAGLLSLFELPEYRQAYVHRIAACKDQNVSHCLG